jgi:hypothetical protein
METFLFKTLISEGRLEDVKKKYPNVSPSVVELLSNEDPSGNNKYLEWSVKFLDSILSKKGGDIEGYSNFIINLIKKFHKNVNKINKNVLDEFFKEERMDYLLNDNSSIAKKIQKIYKNPKDINSYDIDLEITEILQKFLNKLDFYLTKSDVKKLETDFLYNSNQILILIPKSYKSSCYYGAGTKWCTTNKNSDSHFNRYTKNDTLIYYINKTESESNLWYKVAFLIEKESGKLYIFDSIDASRTIESAKNGIGVNWEIVKDTIVNYLFEKNLKGVDNFLEGQELITWYDSKNVDILKVYEPEKLLKKLGFDFSKEYLNKRGINIFDEFEYTDLFEEVNRKIKNNNQTTIYFWQTYKKMGINPLTKMLPMYLNNNERKFFYESLVVTILNNGISVDEFLYYSFEDGVSLPGRTNIFSILEGGLCLNSYSICETYINFILKISDNSKDFFLKLLSTYNLNITEVFNKKINLIFFVRGFSDEEKYIFIIENYNKLDNLVMTQFGVDEIEFIRFLREKNVDEQILNEIIENTNLFSLPKTLIYFFLKGGDNVNSLYELFFSKNPETFEISTFEELLENLGTYSKELFKDIQSIREKIESFYGEKTFYIEDKEIYYKNLYDGDFYTFFNDYDKIFKNLADLFDYLRAYNDSPLDTENDFLKNKLINKILSEMKGNLSNGLLEYDGKNFYVSFNDLCELKWFFGSEDRDTYVNPILCGDSDFYDRFYFDYYDDIDYYITEGSMKLIYEKVIKDRRDSKVYVNELISDKYEEWVESDDNGNFIILEEERILSMDINDFIRLGEDDDYFTELKHTILNSYDNAYNSSFESDVYTNIMNNIENIFTKMGYKEFTFKKNDEEKIVNAVYFRYDDLISDLISVAENYSFDSYYSDGISNAYELIDKMMNYSIGRFDGYLSLDMNFDYWSPGTKEMGEYIYNYLNDYL